MSETSVNGVCVVDVMENFSTLMVPDWTGRSTIPSNDRPLIVTRSVVRIDGLSFAWAWFAPALRIFGAWVAHSVSLGVGVGVGWSGRCVVGSGVGEAVGVSVGVGFGVGVGVSDGVGAGVSLGVG